MYYNKVEICGVNTSDLKVLTDEEKQEIQFVADALGMTRTDAIIKGIRLLKAEIEK